MGTHGRNADVDATTACRIADFIEMRLSAMEPEQHVLADLTITDRPKKHVTFTPDMQIDQMDAIRSLFGELRTAAQIPAFQQDLERFFRPFRHRPPPSPQISRGEGNRSAHHEMWAWKQTLTGSPQPKS
jgi:hypothetical protein